MTKRVLALALLVLLAIPCLGVIVSQDSSPSAPTGNVTADFQCRSFGQTATADQAATFNLKYASPIICWATGANVSGTNVNGSGFVGDVWFDWNWNDNSLGTVSRGGNTWDLGKSVGLIASHNYRPSSFVDTCGGGSTNALKTLTLTVYSVVAGTRESDTASLSVCIENPAVTWPAPVCFGDDGNCTDDAGVPAGAVQGGNLASADTILRYCETAGASKRVVVKGGITATTSSTSLSLGSQSCLIEAYGTGKPKIKFLSTSNTATGILMNNTCGGVRFNNITFAGSGTGPKLIGGSSTNSGCASFVDSAASSIAGEELASTMQSDPTGAGLNQEMYWYNWDYNNHGSALNSFYVFGKYIAWVGGSITKSGEHLIRMPQANYVVIDGVRFDGNQGGADGKHLIAIRNDCGSVGTCINSLQDDVIAITRNELRGRAAGAALIEFLNDGSGALTESTKTYDVDIIWNLMSKHTSGNVPRSPVLSNLGECNCGEEMKRFRFIGNAIDAFAFNSSSSRLLELNGSSPSEIAFIGNVMSGPGDTDNPIAIISGSPTNLTAKNNVCYENGTGACDLFPSVAESTDNKNLTSDPWDRDGAAPGTLDSFDWPDVLITHASALAGTGVIDSLPTDIEGESIPQSADYDAGVDDE